MERKDFIRYSAGHRSAVPLLRDFVRSQQVTLNRDYYCLESRGDLELLKNSSDASLNCPAGDVQFATDLLVL